MTFTVKDTAETPNSDGDRTSRRATSCETEPSEQPSDLLIFTLVIQISL